MDEGGTKRPQGKGGDGDRMGAGREMYGPHGLKNLRSWWCLKLPQRGGVEGRRMWEGARVHGITCEHRPTHKKKEKGGEIFGKTTRGNLGRT